MAVRDTLEPSAERDPLTRPPDPGPDAPPPTRATAAEAVTSAQRILGHVFDRPDLLGEALTHRSAARARATPGRRRHRAPKGEGSNERLEFVGDRVLGLVVAEWLAERFPDEQEGQLALRLAHLVSRTVLSGIGEAIGLSDIVDVAPNEARSGVGRLATVLSDALEALIGALYLDGGLEPARRFVRRTWSGLMDAQAAPPKDPKTGLQEWAQARGLGLPAYVTDSQTGPSHNPEFNIAVTIDGPAAKLTGRGTAGSKRLAERLAAADLLARLEQKQS